MTWHIKTRNLITSLTFILCSLTLIIIAEDETLIAPALAKQELNVWVKIHQQKKSDAVYFQRQAHGGSCFDDKRGQLILFGSNTHGKEFTNSPLLFDVLKNEWSRIYPNDAFETYTVTDTGLPVCGVNADHPWASHTFGAVNYDTSRGEMVVACFDDHLVPGRFTNEFQTLWPKIKLKPTWIFDFEKKKWSPLPCVGVSFFPHSTAYDSDRKVIIGYLAGKIYELGGEPREWKPMANGGAFGWHNNCVYDSKNKALVIFGSNENSNDVGVYLTSSKEYKKMPTVGVRPPKDQHNPMEFHPEIGKTVVLVDRTIKKDGAEKDSTETWLYDLGKDEWSQIKTASLPFPCGMNYNMEYDPNNKSLLLITENSGSTSVWALKLSN